MTAIGRDHHGHGTDKQMDGRTATLLNASFPTAGRGHNKHVKSDIKEHTQTSTVHILADKTNHRAFSLHNVILELNQH